MVEHQKSEVVYEGQHLSMLKQGRWEFATRNTNRPSVGIVAITDQRKVILVEQFRPPVGQSVIELPAGLAGDIQGSEDEILLEAAKRELLEETGYNASNWKELGQGFSSPGLTDESIVLFLATQLKKQDNGGGVDQEDITVHEIELNKVTNWITEKGAAADLKLMAGLFWAQLELYSLEKI